LVAVLVAVEWKGLVASPPGTSNAANVITLVFMAFVTWKIAAGRGWARWLFVVVYVLGCLMGSIAFLLRPEVFRVLPPVAIASSLIQLVVQTVAVALLFLRSTREWFKRHRVHSAPSAAA
jgi:hypothetical protein